MNIHEQMEKTALNRFILDQWPTFKSFVDSEEALSLLKKILPTLGRSSDIDTAEFYEKLESVDDKDKVTRNNMIDLAQYFLRVT